MKQRRRNPGVVVRIAFTCGWLLLAFLAPAMAQNPTPTPDLDLNQDGLVDDVDLLLFLGHWHMGERFTPTPVMTETPYVSPTPTQTETPYVSPTPTLSPSEITVLLPNLPGGAQPLVLRRIPSGSFQMGSLDSTSWTICGLCEQPVRTVNIDYSFYMGKYEITQAQWQAVMGSNPAHSYGVGNDYPVYYVSWLDITQTNGFLDRLNALGQGTFRLPSEAEWEYACRAGTTTRFSFGDSTCQSSSCGPCELSQYGWFCGNNTPEGTKRVGQFLPNAFGLYDVHGNVWEWCLDYWHNNYDGAPSDGSAWLSPTHANRIIRGGGWDYSPASCRSSRRLSGPPTVRLSELGLRIVREP